MAEKKVLREHGLTNDKIQAVRDLIAGPQIRALEIKIEKLAQQVEQLLAQNQNVRAEYNKKFEHAQADFEARAERMIRRAARHRARTTLRLKHVAHEMQKIAKQFAVEHETRAAFAKTMAALARQLRTLPAPPRLNFSALAGKSKPTRKNTKSGPNHAEQS
ncbi:MAG: hypothetical protein AAB354_12080 [candidate division KSB1 bacterium]